MGVAGTAGTAGAAGAEAAGVDDGGVGTPSASGVESDAGCGASGDESGDDGGGASEGDSGDTKGAAGGVAKVWACPGAGVSGRGAGMFAARTELVRQAKRTGPHRKDAGAAPPSHSEKSLSNPRIFSDLPAGASRGSWPGARRVPVGCVRGGRGVWAGVFIMSPVGRQSPSASVCGYGGPPSRPVPPPARSGYSPSPAGKHWPR